ncbi:phosphate ABC transporter permease subunit PstC [Vibrio alfacsensis]|uniref:phosphate ABC transporter permease subunit PstC n=1 Tax=Vibrio alfacsensis TaxID=1074311 RepID=UPI0040690DD8
MYFFFAVLLCAALSFLLARLKAIKAAQSLGGARYLHSLPNYYGWYAMWMTALPVLLFMLVWQISEPWLVRHLTLEHFTSLMPISETGTTSELLYAKIQALDTQTSADTNYQAQLIETHIYYRELSELSTTMKAWIVILLIAATSSLALYKIKAEFRARPYVEQTIRFLLAASSTIAILTTIGIVLSVLYESILFFSQVPINEFLFGTHWSPQIAIREDQQGASGSFGAIPLFLGTLLITVIAMSVAAPVGLFSAIYLAEYAPEKARNIIKPMMEILAGIPTVVYGFFAALFLAPAIRNMAESLGSQSASSESALAAGVVMGVMIIPFVSSLSDDVIRAVPQSLRDASLAMGATHSETIKKVVLPAALPGIVGGLLLAVSRAIGETMIVVMAAGLAANLTANPLESVTTITVQIVTLLVGDQEFDSVKTLAAFALGLTLFLITLCLNVAALRIVKKYREQYE